MLNALRSKLALFAALFSGFMLTAVGVASATPADPVADAFDDGQTSISTYIGLGVAVIAAIVVLGIGVTILVKYLRKAAHAA
jgi:hypothetical protein